MVEELLELLPLLVEDAVLEELEEADVLEEVEVLEEVGVLEAGATGWKLAFVVPKPIFDAKRPPTDIGTVVLSPVRTSCPLPLSDAVT